MDASWFVTSGHAVLMVFLSALGIYAALVVFTRLTGLRSFSKMSSFDFAVTVAFGSLLASTVLTEDPPLLQAAAGLAALYLIQYVVSRWRVASPHVSKVVDNRPLLLMAGSNLLRENMRRARVTELDLRSKLREANVTRMDQVKAVVMETTGDISVLHGEPAAALDRHLLEGVEGAELLP